MTAIEVIEQELVRLHEMYERTLWQSEQESIRKLIDKLHAALIKAIERGEK